MTYTFKLSRRLAASRDRLLAATAIILAACAHDSTAPGAPEDAGSALADGPAFASVSYKRIALHPTTRTLAPGTRQQYKVWGISRSGERIRIAATFKATGGTITSGGLYTAGTSAGSFRVIATASGKIDTAFVTVARSSSGGMPAPSHSPVAFGPFGAWRTDNELNRHTEVFTGNLSSYTPGTIIERIAVARTRGLRLMLAMTGGARANYLTNDVFDMSKWKARMDGYDTAEIRAAVAAGVADGTIVGNSVMDEPNNDGGPGNEANSWGPAGTMTKAKVDEMCRYVKGMFPSLPTGVFHDHDGFEPERSYATCDFIVSQYRAAKGDVRRFRDAGLALGHRDGHAVAFSLNVTDGGIRDNDRDRDWECPVGSTGGPGSYAPNCAMTPDQIEEFGRVLGSAGCMLTLWKFDESYMGLAANQTAFRNLRTFLSGVTSAGCHRTA